MALRVGELNGVEKLIDSGNLGTIELSTGIQISGLFEGFIKDDRGELAYIQTSGPTALSNRDKELIGHGIEHHKDGFGCPIGYLKGRNLPIEDMTPRDLDAYGIYEGKIATLEFESGVVVEGRVVTGTRDLQGKIILITFDDCSVTYKDRVLFKPEWGAYDMAIGKEVISAFAGPADVNSFEEIGQVSNIVMQKIYYSDSEKKLFNMYSVVREIRESSI